MTEPRCPAAPGFSNMCGKAFPSGVVLRAANHTELHALQAIKIFKKDFNCLKGMEFT